MEKNFRKYESNDVNLIALVIILKSSYKFRDAH